MTDKDEPSELEMRMIVAGESPLDLTKALAPTPVTDDVERVAIALHRKSYPKGHVSYPLWCGGQAYWMGLAETALAAMPFAQIRHEPAEGQSYGYCKKCGALLPEEAELECRDDAVLAQIRRDTIEECAEAVEAKFRSGVYEYAYGECIEAIRALAEKP